ncbi:hypothetical protein QH494_26295 [Sphingomonas sp. AR_OL41]|uniref:hypothetical protein n=1 Tax=Sphingomonas sp. AR_OL41 TaxID=3042729 RepID=UPI00247FCF51|nr:hypothetical protein [Sphingomonas sp. AR_OL41]MDH7975712.1 hypothetical protein [Sphingomonas sp. AR_OL41]
MIFTFFSGVRDNRGAAFEVDIPNVIEILSESAEAARCPSQKLDAIMLSTTSYPDGLTRAKANAVGAEAIAMDVDEGWTIDEAEAAVLLLETPYIIHSTTKCTQAAHRFRIILFLNRMVSASEYEMVWLALTHRFGVPMDVTTRDISRLSVMPAAWAGAHNDFRSEREGQLIDVDAVLQTCPAPVPRELPDVWRSPSTSRRFFDPLAVHRAELRRLNNGGDHPANLTDLDTSPIVPPRALEEALSGNPGGRTFRLLCSVAMSARSQGYDVDEHDLIMIAREFSYRIGRRTSESELRHDASNALNWAAQQV